MTRSLTLTGDPPIIIAHRGASGYLPEHTLAAYDLAIEMGADFIEPDLVLTSDGHLIARHDRYLGLTTNVSDKPAFADRRTKKPGHAEPEWYAEDFTLAEIKTLKARQPFPGRSDAHDDIHDIATFEQVLELATRRSAELGRSIGVYPETKQPTLFASIGLDFKAPLLDALEGFEQPVFIQSFEPHILMELRELTGRPLIMLLLRMDDGTPHIPLDMAKDFAFGIGPAKTLLIDSKTGKDTGLVAHAHDLGMAVHPWTFRDDFVGEGFETIDAELNAYLALGIDGLFSDFSDTAVSVRGQR
ncbi:MAG: glycerophosphodiester phosphodiesterase family protein [Alphaproteobacteria bacterium]